MKDFGAEVRASMDVDQFLQQAVLLLDVNETSLEGIVDRIVKKVSQPFACLLPLALSCFRGPFLSLIPVLARPLPAFVHQVLMHQSQSSPTNVPSSPCFCILVYYQGS